MGCSLANSTREKERRREEANSCLPGQKHGSRSAFWRARRHLCPAPTTCVHPRCLNSLPATERPTQGEDLHPHSPLVVRGLDDRGAAALRCTTCHGAANFAPSGVPGHPFWHMAPGEMAWQGKSLAQICEQIKDLRHNGGRTLAQIHEHVAHDSLVGWAWRPGGSRKPAPGTQEEFGALVAAWIESGAACPVDR